MDTVNAKELGDPEIYPDSEILKGVLGSSWSSYENLIRLYDSKGMTHEWRYYRDGKAWLCKVQHRKRTIVWMSAWRGYMQATVYFPLSRLELVMGLDIGEAAKEKIHSTKDVGKSKPCIFEIRSDGDLADLEKVMDLKIAAK